MFQTAPNQPRHHSRFHRRKEVGTVRQIRQSLARAPVRALDRSRLLSVCNALTRRNALHHYSDLAENFSKPLLRRKWGWRYSPAVEPTFPFKFGISRFPCYAASILPRECDCTIPFAAEATVSAIVCIRRVARDSRRFASVGDNSAFAQREEERLPPRKRLVPSF